MVGTGGQYRSGGAGQGPTVYGGGGNTGTAGYGGQGGGRSAIRRSSTELISAGGGGGAGWDISGDWGGGGGGTVGQDANNGSNGGKGGTQSAGGAGGGSAEAGSAYQGGTCNDGDGGGGGGGGGGYYGGGAGTGSSNGGGGGGGSAFVPSGGSTLSGSGVTPGNNSDSDRGTAGTGGPVGTNGYSGRVVISYAGGLAKNTLDVFGSIAAGSYAGINTSPNNGFVISGNVGIGTYSPSTLLQLGTAGITAGIFSMAGGTSGLITLQTAAAAGTWTMTLPNSAGSNGYVLQTDGTGITSWVALSANAWTDGGTYLYPTNRESIRVYDSGGTDYVDLAHNGTDAIMSFANTGLLNINSNTLVVDVADNRVGIGTADPAATLDIATSNTAYDTTARVARITNSNSGGQSPFDYYINGTLRGRTRVDSAGNFTVMANGGYFSFLSGGDYGVGTEVMRILANGNVGLGNTVADRRLEVGSASVSGDSTIWAGSTSWGEGLRLLAKDANSYASYFVGSATDDANGIEWALGRLNVASGDGARNDLVITNKDWTSSGLNIGSTAVQLWFDKSTGYSAFGSRLGVNTSAPQTLLHVKGTVSYGSIRISPTSDNGESAMAFFQDAAGTDNNDAWGFGQGAWGNTGDLVFGNENNGAGGNVRMLIQKDGLIGIGGNTSPNEVLTANGRLSLQATTAPSATTGYGKLYVKTNDLYYMNPSGTEYAITPNVNFWTDGGTYLYPTNRESIRVYDSGGTDYVDLAHNGTDAIMSFANTGLLNINSNTLVVDVADNRVGVGIANPNQKLEVNTDLDTPQLRVSYSSHYVDFMSTNGYFGMSNADRIFRLTSGASTTPKYTELSTNTDGYLYVNPQGIRTGYGTSAPDRELEVHGDYGYADGSNPQFRVSYFSGTGTSWIDIGAAHETGNISTSHNVLGIGNTSPKRALDVLNASNPQLRLTNTVDTYYTDFQTTSSGYLYVNASGSRVGIGDSTPDAFFSVGSSSQFQVDSSGNIVKINNVTYSWPSSQGAANTYLKNDGSGNLTWTSDMMTSSYVGECTASTTTPEGSAECTVTGAKYLMISGFDSGADAQHTCAVHFQGNVGGTAHGYAWLGAGGTVSSCTFIGFK
jgi:hypothetical protein